MSSSGALAVSLRGRLTGLWDHAIAPNTRRVYQSGVRAYLHFMALIGCACSEQNLSDLTEDTLLLFVTYCHYVLNVRHTTIKGYLCGVRFIYLRQAQANPWTHGSTVRLETIMQSLKRLQGTTSLTRLPITLPILTSMCHLLRQRVFSPYVNILIATACCVAFFAFLRCSEFTCDNYNAEAHLSMGSVTFNDDYSTAYILLQSSKMDPFRKGVTVSLHSIPNSIVCPVKALRQFLVVRKHHQHRVEDPLFLTPQGKAMDRQFFVVHLKCVLAAAGFDEHLYNGHSFRIGAATTAARAHIPDHMIKILGRWSSDCYNRYIRTSQDSIRVAQRAMSLAPP